VIPLNPQQTVSMTELQKLSLKKLRQKNLPLIVMDMKSKKGGFVILDYETFLNLKEKKKDEKLPLPSPSLKQYDFRKKGLLWDYPEISNEEFAKRLKNTKHPEHIWAISRLLERLPSKEILKFFTIMEIKAMLEKANVRDFVRKPWEHAITYYHQKTSRRR
jgi:hypothetical protein